MLGLVNMPGVHVGSGEIVADTIAEQLLHMIRGYWVSQIVGALAALKNS